MKHILVFPIVLLSSMLCWAQTSLAPGEEGFLDQNAKFDFKNKFSALLLTQETSNYYLVDLGKLPTRFERIYFINMSFSKTEIVNIVFDPDKNVACFKAHTKYSGSEISSVFDQLLNSTTSIAATLPPEKQAEWLKQNDKYKKAGTP